MRGIGREVWAGKGERPWSGHHRSSPWRTGKTLWDRLHPAGHSRHQTGAGGRSRGRSPHPGQTPPPRAVSKGGGCVGEREPSGCRGAAGRLWRPALSLSQPGRGGPAPARAVLLPQRLLPSPPPPPPPRRSGGSASLFSLHRNRHNSPEDRGALPGPQGRLHFRAVATRLASNRSVPSAGAERRLAGPPREECVLIADTAQKQALDLPGL